MPLRLLALLAAATMPALAALLYVQIGLRHDRVQRVEEGVQHQAQLLAADIAMLTDAAHQLTQAVSVFDTTQQLAAGCDAQLAALRQALGSYALLQVVGVDGRVICATPRALRSAALEAQEAAALASGRFTVGRYLAVPDEPPMLPMLAPFTSRDGRRGLVIAAIDLNWLSQDLARFHAAPNNSVNVADADGRVLMRLPQNERYRGHMMVPAAQALVHAPQPGMRDLTGIDGLRRTVGYVPVPASGGLYVSYGVYVPDLLVAIDRAAQRGYVLIAVCALISLLLMLLITRRLVHAPTEILLSAANRWAQGDLAARATLDVSEANEFGRMATAFNTMAETLDTRRRDLRELNASLEARVAERTQELSDSNNRLLVEINERERTDAALRQAQKLQAVGQLAGGMAHEFNNLLTAILGALELLRLRLDAGSSLQSYVGVATSSAQRGGRLTSQLLAFARRRRLMPLPVDLNAVIVEMRELLESTLGRSIEIVLDLAPDAPAALADRHEVEAAILNLALNARDAMPQGGSLRFVTRAATLPPAAGSMQPGHYVELQVVDRGIGMTDEELNHAIVPFYTTKGPGESAGLGLSQVHGLVQQLGGELQITSEKQRGTSVSLFLPQAAQRASPCGDGPPGCGALLLVDDDPQVRQITADMLCELGYRVTSASGGAEALAIMDARGCADAFATMVADYAMPGMTGVELIQAARQRMPSLVVLMITGYAEFGNSADVEVLSPIEVLRKPFTMRELSRRIAELSSERTAQTALLSQ